MKESAQHSSDSVEWYTPRLIVLMARHVMGGIDLDPCSCAVANEVIEAERFYTEADDGLTKKWAGKVYLNPPGGKRGATSGAAQWWRKLTRSPGVDAAIVMGFNPSILFTCQADAAGDSPTDWPVCYPRKRVAFWREGIESKHPPHPSVVIGYKVDAARFAATFGRLGKVVVPS